MTRRFRAALPGLLVLAVVLPGCGGDGDDGAAPATSTAASPSAADSGSPSSGASDDDSGEAPPDSEDDGGGSSTPFTANTDPDTGEATGDGPATVTDIRIGGHEGFDRVVFEADGGGVPGWDVRYVGGARSQGKGEDIELAGGAVLQVSLTGVGLPFETGIEEYSGPDRLSSREAAVVTEVVWDSTFEGISTAFVGVSEETPFRVYSLEDPARVVLEVADPG